ncbi:hypothetical protein BJY52DRAFT_608525 [Lactarius psammicola]|nr:hypothetical protein BJY52DRAFT_608525 [Lactarius psammicola]
MEPVTTINDVKTDRRFRILAVGRSGVGKSSLINRVLGINTAKVSHLETGVSDIEQEYVSPWNRQFVLHDSNGFEPGDLVNYEIVRQFILQRSNQGIPPEDRVHGIWLCTETPPAGGRVFEKGDELLVEFAHKIQVPLVIVFTQYDRLVRTKKAELEEDEGITDPVRSEEDAQKAFEKCLGLVRRTIERYLKVPMPRYAKVSVRPNYPADVTDLVKVTVDILNHGMTQTRSQVP